MNTGRTRPRIYLEIRLGHIKPQMQYTAPAGKPWGGDAAPDENQWLGELRSGTNLATTDPSSWRML